MERLIKHSRPSSHVTAEYGTIWEAHVETIEIYIQTSKDESHPQWRRYGSFLEKAYEKCIDDPEFIMDSLDLYRGNMGEE